MTVYEIRQYTDDEGKLITARLTLDTATLQPVVTQAKYFGTYTIPHPQLGAMRMEFEFPEGWDIEKCFQEFRNEAEKDFTRVQEDAQKEAAARKLWTPSTGNNKGLIVPK